MISIQKVEDGARFGTSLISILLRYGVTHNPQSPSVVELLDPQWQRCTSVMIVMSAVAVIISYHNTIIVVWFSSFNK